MKYNQKNEIKTYKIGLGKMLNIKSNRQHN